MNFTDLVTAEFWRELLSNDFNRGYMAAIGLVLAVFILALVLRLAMMLLFRTRRCNWVPVPSESGNLVVSRKAIENAARQVLEAFPQLTVRRISLYRRGKKRYLMTLQCYFSAKGKGLVQTTEEVKPKMLEMLTRVFGIEALKEIRFQVEALEDEISTGDSSPAKTDEEVPLL